MVLSNESLKFFWLNLWLADKLGFQPLLYDTYDVNIFYCSGFRMFFLTMISVRMLKVDLSGTGRRHLRFLRGDLESRLCRQATWIAPDLALALISNGFSNVVFF